MTCGMARLCRLLAVPDFAHISLFVGWGFGVARSQPEGFLGDYSDNMDTCIALRTIVIKDNMAYLQAGAGIVADSDPTSEYEETLNKARGLLHAIQMTEARVNGSVTG